MRCIFLLGLVAACSGSTTSPPDASADGGSLADATFADGAELDAGMMDATMVDATLADVRLTDALLDTPADTSDGSTGVDAGPDAMLPEFVTPEMFGAVDGEESGGAINAALATGRPVVLAGSYTTAEDIILPAHTVLTGGGTIATSPSTYVYIQGSHIRVEDVIFDFTNGGTMTTRPPVEGEVLDDLVFRNVQFNNSQRASGILLQHVRNVSFLQCGATNNHRKGLYIRWFEGLTVDGGEYQLNGHFGVFAADGTDVTLTDLTAHHNGLEGGFSGIAVLRVVGALSDTNTTHHNGEHGEGYQGVVDFQIRDFNAHDNASSGINLQSDGARVGPHMPCRDGNLMNGRATSNGRTGIVLKEQNVNVRIIDNFVSLSPRGIHLVDIRGSERRSSEIYFEGNTFGPREPPVLRHFVNSNGSDISGDYLTYR